MKFRTMFLFWFAVLVGLGIAIGYRSITRPYSFEGTNYDPPKQITDFTLVDYAGQPYRLSDQKGKVVLLFFGYTNCPDICPTTLAEFRKVREGLGERAERVEFIFITLDPERDTPERMAEYLPVFDAKIVGLTGEMDELGEVWRDFGAYRQIVDAGSASGYLLDHSTRAYALDTQGRLQVSYLFGTPVVSIVKDVDYLLKQK
jgi:protein SCO1